MDASVERVGVVFLTLGMFGEKTEVVEKEGHLEVVAFVGWRTICIGELGATDKDESRHAENKGLTLFS